MSPDHDSPDYCPIHGIKAMLTDEGISEHWNDLGEAKAAVDAHLNRMTHAKVRKLKALSKTIHKYARDANASKTKSREVSMRLAYMNLMAKEVDSKLYRIDKEW